ncbi:hypothetical protein [Mesonia aquimarina]|uniref:hypothetical protein n=1 Tax=Mesonia aquimarina TaxID=1504967 RepID=UPI000EF629D1|nr:hypothetical protein [Mesonia aquimarina]
MKSKIFMYLFLFAVLYIIFQYANVQKTFEVQQEEITSLQAEVDTITFQRDSLQTALDLSTNDGFSLVDNDKARAYFEDLGYEISYIEKKVESDIISKNKIDTDNELIPYSGMSGKFRVNRIKILNHKWVLAEFTDSEYWGEALISYFIDEEGKIFFETKDAFIYPNY